MPLDGSEYALDIKDEKHDENINYLTIFIGIMSTAKIITLKQLYTVSLVTHVVITVPNRKAIMFVLHLHHPNFLSRSI